MARYQINHSYQSSVIGLDAGAIVDLDDSLAEWLERDSPGVLTATDAAEAPRSGQRTRSPRTTPVPATSAAAPKPKRPRTKG